MHNPYMTTGVDSAAPPAQENMPYDSNWMDYPQATMASFSSPEFAYMPPMTTHDLSPHVSPHDIPSQLHDMPQNDVGRMPPPLQPRHSPTLNQEHADGLPDQQQQDQQDQQDQQQQQQQQPPLSMPPLAMAHQSPHHHHLPQLPMLTVPSHPTWPSMLTNPGQYAQTQSIHITPRAGPPPPAPPPLKTKLSEREGRPNPRKMLTDDDRRKMCEYAEAHPGIKQSEIGAYFGVERSTVSKVLRNKDKYMSKDDRSKSPGGKKGKGGKFPDIERALSNWVRNAQRTGMALTDADIREKLRFFATNTGNPDPILKSSTTSWLEKFKQKNGIGASGRLVRRASETNIPKRKSSINSMSSMNRVMQSPLLGPPATAGTGSPLSPITRQASTSPTSANRSDEERDTLSAGAGSLGQHFMGHSGHLNAAGLGGSMTMGISISGMGYKNGGGNQSSGSLTSVYADTPVSSFSSTAPYTFSPDPNVGSFLDTDPMAPPGSANFQRPRSQTLPALNMDYMNHAQQQQQQQHDQQQHQHQQQQQQHDQQQHQHQQHQQHGPGGSAPGDAMTPKYLHHHHMSSTAPSSAVDSPMTDVSGPSYGLDSAVVSPQLRRSGSNGSLFQANPRSAGGLGGTTILGSPLSANGGSTNTNGGGGSTPSSPTQDDARRAADTLLTFIKMGPSGFDQTDLMAMARMVDKLRLQQAASKSHHSLGHSHSHNSHTHTHGGMGGLSQIPEGEGEMGHDMAAHVKTETIAA